MRLASIAIPFALALVAATGGPAAAGTPPRVAVVPQLAVNVDEHRAQALTAELAQALHDHLVVDAIGGADVVRRLPADGLAEDCVAQKACIADVARRLDADQLLFVVMVEVGEDIQIDVTWVDGASGRSVSRPRLLLEADARAGTVFGEAASRLLPDAEVRRDTLLVAGTTVREPRHMTAPVWIAAGAGVAFLGAGIGLGLSARSTYQRCEPPGTCSDGELDGLATRALFADVGFGLAVGAAVTSAILWYRSGGEVPVQLKAGPDGAGVSWGGHF